MKKAAFYLVESRMDGNFDFESQHCGIIKPEMGKDYSSKSARTVTKSYIFDQGRNTVVQCVMTFVASNMEAWVYVTCYN